MENEYYLADFDSVLSLKEIIASLLYEDIEVMAEERIVQRGFSYFKQGFVENIIWSRTALDARVEGSEGALYEVHISLDDTGDLLGQCDCPYDDTCKHIIATLLHANKNIAKNEKDNKKDTKQFLLYLSTLEKEELVSLVDRFAPENYRIEVAMHDASEQETQKAMKRLEVLMFHRIEDTHLLYDPAAFFNIVDEYLNMLDAYLVKAPEEVFEKVFDLAEKITDLSDEGYLYCDSYYSECEYFDYDSFSKKIVKMINRIDDAEIQANLIVDFAMMCEASDYLYVDYGLIQVQNKRLLIDACEEVDFLSFYDFMSDVLDFDQRMIFLERLAEEDVAIRKVALLEDYGKEEEAIRYLEELLSKKFSIIYVEYLLKLTKISQVRLSQLVLQAIESSEYNAYDFIVKYMGKCHEIEKLEKEMKKLKPHWYYKYLSKQQRVNEMHAMLKTMPHEKYNFFKKYKKHYPEEATNFYQQVIVEELAYTGNTHYTNIANALSHLQSLLPKEVFDARVHSLKTEYKRRPNFVKILEQRFATMNKALL